MEGGRVVVVIPDPDRQLGVFAVALEVFRRPLAATLVGGHDQLGIGELDVVALEEDAQLGTIAGRLGRRRVVVDDAVTMAVNSENSELFVEEHLVAIGVDPRFFQRAGDLRLEGVAGVDAERGMPVGIDVAAVIDPRNAGTIAGATLAPVDNEQKTQHDDEHNGDWEYRAALEANLLAFSSRGEFGNFFGG